MTATCARLAASARRVKSLRKGSVEAILVWMGAGAMAAAELLGDGLVDEAADEEATVEEEGSMAGEGGEEDVIGVVGSCVKSWWLAVY